jgi:hypothetical protein
MTWDNTNLYVAEAAYPDKGHIIFIDSNPTSPPTSGTDASGSLTGPVYDRTQATLPFRADFVMYLKPGYVEYRKADGSGGWNSAVANTLTHATDVNSQESQIPWSVITGAGRPANFDFLTFATYDLGASTNGVEGNLPTGNSGGAWNVTGPTTMPQARYYEISSTADTASTKPFAANVPVALSRFTLD